MYLQLVREYFTNTSTEGKLFINGEFECYTLEDKDRWLEKDGEKIYGKTAIPRGVYEIIISYSNRFKQEMPEILKVPGFTGVRMHVGNTSADTDGCVLVGRINKDGSDDFIGESKKAYMALMDKLKYAIKMGEKISLEIV